MRDIPPPDKWLQNPEPPGRDKQCIPLIRAPQAGTVEAALLDGHVHGIELHVIDQRDTPCAGTDCTYQFNGQHRGTRWKGFMAAFDLNHGRKCILEITAEAYRHYQDHLRQSIPLERGVMVSLRRLGKQRNSPVKMDVRQAYVESDDLPDTFDVLDALFRIWNGELREKRGTK